ncbi:MAG TPA: hypothetical protein VF668_00455 [Pyrinomonadaceae bacterium]|jgi:hypothetical protein
MVNKHKSRGASKGAASSAPAPTAPANPTADRPPENLLQVVLRILYSLGRLGQVLLVVLLFCGAALVVWSQIPEQGKLNIINRVLYGSPIVAGYYPSVEIEQSKVKFDFTEWTPKPPAGDAGQCCKVTSDEEMVVRRVQTGAVYLARRVGTSGQKPDFTSSTHQVSYQETSGRIGGTQMSHYELFLDISKAPVNVPFKAHLRSVRYRGFSDKDHEWAAPSVFQPTRLLIIELQFSSSKPGRNFKFGSSAEFDGGNKMQLYPTLGESQNPGVGYYEISGDTLRWTIQYPKIGYSYRVDWDW